MHQHAQLAFRGSRSWRVTAHAQVTPDMLNMQHKVAASKQGLIQWIQQH